MIVKAKQGATCPMEGRKRGRITDSEPVNVPDTAYYQRLVVEGSLIEETESFSASNEKAKPEDPAPPARINASTHKHKEQEG